MNQTAETNLQAMTPKEVHEKIVRKEKLFILDVRNEEDYADWRIEGDGITSINIPYFDMLDGVEAALQHLPNDQPILVACAKVGSSEFIAKQLIDAGVRDVFYLEGGMKAWSEYLHPVKAGDLPGGAIYQFVRPGKGCLSYMVLSDGEAAVIDAVRIIDPFLQFAEQHQVQIKHVIDTHVHADHISGGRMLASRTGAMYWLPPKDAGEVTFAYRPLIEGHNIQIGNPGVTIKPVYSPGHTIGSTSLIVNDQYLLTGDLLFVESIGRPDLAGKALEWVGDLRHTLYHTFRNLDADLIVLPAHFGHPREMDAEGRLAARLGDLFRLNEGLQVEHEDDFRRMVTEDLPPQPNSYREIRQVNMGKLHPTEEEQREMEIGPNRCAVHA